MSALLLAAPLALAGGCRVQDFPQSAIHPRSDYAREIHGLLEAQVFWVVVIFILVQGLLIVAALRFRSRPGAPDPKPVHGNTLLEIAWTIAPAVILAIIAVPTVRVIFATQAKPPDGALRVRAIGHQWWWEFRYPDHGVTTGSEMHVPRGAPVIVDIETADVVHSFWFPAVGGKRDAIPGRVNRMWFTADEAGTYPGQCAELCGTSHANMKMWLVVHPEEGFQAWLAGQQTPPAEPDSGSLAWQGRRIYATSGCVACHTVRGLSAGVLGPDLTHVGSRMTLGGAMYANTPENMGRWITDSPAMKPGSKMLSLEALGMSAETVPPLVEYLRSLK